MIFVVFSKFFLKIKLHKLLLFSNHGLQTQMLFHLLNKKAAILYIQGVGTRLTNNYQNSCLSFFYPFEIYFTICGSSTATAYPLVTVHLKC